MGDLNIGLQEEDESIVSSQILIDHFDIFNKNKFEQKYVVIDDFVRNKQEFPVFLYICGEQTHCRVKKSKQYVDVLADNFGGLVIALEHRYYGESQPFENLSTENLKYLTVENSLEDINQFISHLRTNGLYGIDQKTKIVLVGGSYPGALVAWFKYKYPHQVVGALASSAVVNVVEQFQQYDEFVYKVLAKMENRLDCLQKFQEFFKFIDHIDDNELKHFVEDHLGYDFVLDDPVSIKMFLSDILASYIQYGRKDKICDMVRDVHFPEEMFEQFNKTIHKKHTMEEYNINKLKKTSIDLENRSADRQWLFQCCSQMGWFQTVSQYKLRSVKIDIEYFNKLCQDSFGFELKSDNIKKMNNRYGGVNMKVNNVIFTNGNDDPWQMVGLHSELIEGKSKMLDWWLYNKVGEGCYYNEKQDVTVINIKCSTMSCSHCADLMTPQQDDDHKLVVARDLISSKVAQWLQYNPQYQDHQQPQQQDQQQPQQQDQQQPQQQDQQQGQQQGEQQPQQENKKKDKRIQSDEMEDGWMKKYIRGKWTDNRKHKNTELQQQIDELQ